MSRRRDDDDGNDPPALFDIPSRVNAVVVQETILAALAIVGARLSIGELDEGRNVTAYAKLLDFAKDFAAIAAAVDGVAAYGRADSTIIDVPRDVSESMQRLRTLMKRPVG